MFSNSIDNKPLFQNNDGNILRDLCQTMFDVRSNNYVSYNMFKLSSDYVMRPDLISQAVYNNSLYAEYILKYNGISNPFSMEEGDIILIPNLEGARSNTKTSAGSAGADLDPSQKLRDAYRYIDPTKIPKRDGNISSFEDRKFADPFVNNGATIGGSTASGQGAAGGTVSAGAIPQTNATLQEGALPPNIAQAGSTQIVQRNGRVYFGEGISESACLKSGMSSSEFLAQVIKSKQS